MRVGMYRWRWVLLIICASSAAQVYAAAAIEDIGTTRSPPRSAPAPTMSGQSMSAPASGVTERTAGGSGQALLEIMRRIEELQIEVQNLRGEMEGMYSNLEAVKNRQREMFLDLDRRMQEMETMVRAGAPPGAAAPVVGHTPVTTTTPTAPASAAPAVDMAAARAAYERAFGLLRDQKYEAAITEFDRFLAEFGQSEYAANAQYWLGEANYAARRYDQAATAFKNVTTHYPTSGKAADAHLKLGFAYYELGKWAEARQALGAVKSQFPNSSAARLAQDRLNRMVQEGH